MKTISAMGAVTLALALSLSAAKAQDAAPHYKAIQAVPNRPFPASEQELLNLRDHPDEAAVRKMRAHAWDLFVGLTKGDPAWQTWYTKCDVKLAVDACPPPPPAETPAPGRLFRNFEIPVQSLHSLEQLYQGPAVAPSAEAAGVSRQSTFAVAGAQFIAEFRKHPQYASVLFNKEAAEHIFSSCLYPLASSERKDCSANSKIEKEIPPFDRPSIVLKTVWEVAHRNPDEGKNVAGPLTTWDSRLWNEIHAPGTDASDFSKSVVMIDTTPGKRCKNRDYEDDEKIPLDCFYFHKLTTDDIKLFPRFLAAFDDKNLQEGDYLILVAMHVTTKEIPEWTWETFWWENHAFSDPHAEGRPHALGRKWRHFLMDTTLSGRTPTERDGGPKICFNPFLETDSRIPNGIISNCLQCHDRAGYGLREKRSRAYDLGILARDGEKLASGNALEPNYFEDFRRTDFLWSLVPPQDTTLKDLLNALHDLALEELQHQ